MRALHPDPRLRVRAYREMTARRRNKLLRPSARPTAYDARWSELFDGREPKSLVDDRQDRALRVDRPPRECLR